MRIPLFLIALSLPAFAGARADVTSAALEGAPTEHHGAIRFLIEHMPEKDLGVLTPEFLRENTALAYEARSRFAFAREIPEEIFLNDVLPYAVLDESRDDWRADFMKRFGKIAEEAGTAREAVILINQAIKGEIGVEYNTKRRIPNQGPEESIDLKMASCTGLSILLVDALRSVGLPARIAGTAMWTTMRGNHNWVEVWLPDSGSWLCTEYDMAGGGLDHGWFLSHAARGIEGSMLHGIFATSWKGTGKHFPMVWDIRDTSVPGIEVTAEYFERGKDRLPAIGECELRIDVRDAADQRVPVTVEVRQADVIVASGESPKPTDDLNNHLSIRVKQGQLYQVRAFLDGKVIASESIEIKADEEARRIAFKLADE